MDGTVIDSSPGVTSSLTYALSKFGIIIKDKTELYKCIGPTLQFSFKNFFGLNEAQIEEAIGYYDEYYEKDGYIYKAYLLVQIAKDKSYDFDKVTISDKYPFSARVFIPGMAQIHKGQKTKGACFITGEIVFVGGAILSHSMMKSNINKINSTHNSTLKHQYTDNANNWMMMRNISIAGAAAVYVWNIIDGIAAKGEKAVFLTNNNISIIPYTDLNSTGFALNFKF